MEQSRFSFVRLCLGNSVRLGLECYCLPKGQSVHYRADFGWSLAKVETTATTAAKENQNPDDGTTSAVIITSAKAAKAATAAATAAAK